MPFNIVHDVDGLPRIILTDPTGSSAEVLLYGGQVVSWKNERREELLFMSSKAVWKPLKANRGGIPVCFPQFGNLGSLEKHGFARNRLWSLDSDPSPLPPVNSQSSVDLILKSTEDDLKTWPRRYASNSAKHARLNRGYGHFILYVFHLVVFCSFELRLRISLGPGKLTLIPRVRNTDNKAFSFTFALCNYLSVSDISEVRIEGLETLDYFDNLMRKERFTEQADAITFDAEIDRVYLSTPSKIAIIDHEKKRTFVLRKEGMPDAVVWNPWDKKARALQDLGDEDYKTMLCVDSAGIETPIILKPFEEWKGYQELCTVSSSYCSGQLDPRKVLYGYQ
ncbi:putative glucose-6-phosphate 1-epimerase isoform X1 [Jatropha curcas]|uniref:putative glucose-6-phosphate 1-epimerase isoform X1 n=1 Tax=Jatropha curcas TaxID=180498 RepID=UPI0009D65C34|nr:putative glucose-6-phosphate 1-epimerase isoform X1 [Jatropha curcas]XP_020534894.1 putative glucose-6-phosphate 1-epimerase isoform X1 [Jatropha curcas]XP_020534896.1 putative glucose-6-phosphate 1-epimerase isoform X1 [Jatropha curcas]